MVYLFVFVTTKYKLLCYILFDVIIIYVLLPNISSDNLPFEKLHPSTWLLTYFFHLHIFAEPNPK